jgi:hypothetical protein
VRSPSHLSNATLADVRRRGRRVGGADTAARRLGETPGSRRLLAKALGPDTVVGVGEVSGDLAEEQDAFVDGAHRVPERLLDRLFDLREQTLDRVGVARMAPEAQIPVLGHLEEHAVTRRTCVGRRPPEALDPCAERLLAFRDLDLDLQIVRHGFFWVLARREESKNPAVALGASASSTEGSKTDAMQTLRLHRGLRLFGRGQRARRSFWRSPIRADVTLSVVYRGIHLCLSRRQIPAICETAA